MAIDDVLRVMPPPATPRTAGSPEEWARIEQTLRFAFPPDYKEFINVYGMGMVNDYILLLSPIGLPARQLKGYLHPIEDFRAGYPGPCPYTLYPEPEGLVDWAQTMDGGILYWHTAGRPEDWTIVNYQPRAKRRFEEYAESMTAFIAKVVTGEIVSALFAEDLAADPPYYSLDFEEA